MCDSFVQRASRRLTNAAFVAAVGALGCLLLALFDLADSISISTAVASDLNSDLDSDSDLDSQNQHSSADRVMMANMRRQTTAGQMRMQMPTQLGQSADTDPGHSDRSPFSNAVASVKLEVAKRELKTHSIEETSLSATPFSLDPLSSCALEGKTGELSDQCRVLRTAQRGRQPIRFVINSTLLIESIVSYLHIISLELTVLFFF
jgi:hypothetical protein